MKLILIFVLILTSTLYSQFIYLSKNGNDNNNGSVGSPVRTINKAIELANNVYSIKATDGQFTTSQANLQTSLFGGFDLNFTFQADSNVTEIVGTGGWGDPKPTVYIASESGITVDMVTVKASESGTKRPVAFYLYYCDSTVIVQNCKIYGQMNSDYATGTEAVYIYHGAPKILNNYIYGGNLNKDINAISGIRAKYFTGEISYNEIIGGSNFGCVHGIWTERSNCKIRYNTINGGISSSSCYSCGIRAGDTAEVWNSSGSDDLIQGNEINGGEGFRTYAVLCSQESDQIIKNNILTGGDDTVVSMCVYIKTNDSPVIQENTFQIADYGIYEWNFGDYSQDDNNPANVRYNYFKYNLGTIYHVFNESNNTEYNVNDVCNLVETDDDGADVLKAWLNTCENCYDECETDTTVENPVIPPPVLRIIQTESTQGNGWLQTSRGDSVCMKSTVLQCSANQTYKLEYSFEIPANMNQIFIYAEFDVNEFSDSFFVQVNNQTIEAKDLFESAGWENELIGEFTVYEGTNYLRLFPREKGVFLNRVIISSEVL